VVTWSVYEPLRRLRVRYVIYSVIVRTHAITSLYALGTNEIVFDVFFGNARSHSLGDFYYFFFFSAADENPQNYRPKYNTTSIAEHYSYAHILLYACGCIVRALCEERNNSRTIREPTALGFVVVIFGGKGIMMWRAERFIRVIIAIVIVYDCRLAPDVSPCLGGPDPTALYSFAIRQGRCRWTRVGGRTSYTRRNTVPRGHRCSCANMYGTITAAANVRFSDRDVAWSYPGFQFINVCKRTRLHRVYEY
jgi:hypothetical protein